MPIMNLTTKSAKQVWASPDGQRKIYELEMDYQGQPVKAKTYSEAIATVGWSGQAETYEKEGRPGMPSQTFVKQPPKEGGYSGSQGGSRGGYQPKDEQAIKAMWAIGQATNLVRTLISNMEKFDKPFEAIEKIEVFAQELFSIVERVKATPADTEVAPPKVDEVHTVPDEPVDLSLVDKVFNTNTDSEEELPWPEKS